MKFHISKLTAMLLLISMLASFAACASDDNTALDTSADTSAASETAETAPSDNPADYYPDIEGMDLKGASFNMIYFSNELSHGWTGIPSDMNPAEETGDILNDAVYNRNRKVEDLVNIVISETPIKGQPAVNEAINTAVMSGDDTYDLAFQSISAIIGLAENGLVRDMYKLGLNTDAPWYDAKSVEEFTISNKLFFVNCDISYIDKLSTIVTFFNKSIAENYNMDDFYKKVEDGEWTYDYMLECAEKISADVDGDGEMGANDTYGISCQTDGAYYLLHSSGLKFSEKTADGLRFTGEDEAFVTTLQNVFDLMDSDLYINIHHFNMSNADAIRMFTEDRSLFLIRPVQSVFGMRDMEADFGIIPVPRYFESDENYYTPMNIYPGVIMCIPQNSKNTDYIGTVVDLLAAEAHENVMPVFYDMVLDSKLVRDEVTAAMLDIAFDNRVYDLGFVWDIGGLRSLIGQHKTFNVASTVGSIVERAEIEIEELYDAMYLAEG